MTATLLADVNHPGSQEDLVSNWEPARSLVEDAISEAKIASHLPALAAACLPLCLWQGEGPVCSQLALLWYLLSPLFCEQAWQCLRLELFAGKFSLSFFPSLCLSHTLGCYLTLAPQIALRSFRPSLYPEHAAHAPLFSPSLLADSQLLWELPLGAYSVGGFVFFFPRGYVAL